MEEIDESQRQGVCMAGWRGGGEGVGRERLTQDLTYGHRQEGLRAWGWLGTGWRGALGGKGGHLAYSPQ